jgi:Na+-transporting methylmalonyl-CoA/oxaloacetate decarboxylase gamma subunit
VEEKGLIVSLVIAISFIVFLVLFVVFSSMRSKSKIIKRVKKRTLQDKKKITIEDMIEIAANRNSTKNDLTNAIIKVAKELPFPKKIKGKLPKGIKVYLNFVLLIASHKNADAKLIAFCNSELKKTNKEYSTEIDIYENEGLRQRANRI